MNLVPLPTKETQRLLALRRYTIVNTSTEETFERLTHLAANLFNVPIALITLIEHAQQLIKSAYGFAAFTQIPREQFFCTHTIENNTPLVVPDTSCDPRFKNNPFVIGEPYISFYAGAPLTTYDGYNIGTLCLLDYQPRVLSEQEIQSLQHLAEFLMFQIEERQRLIEIKTAPSKLLEDIFHSFSAQIAVLDGQGVIRYVSRSWECFALENGGEIGSCGSGTNYLESCRKVLATNPSLQEVVEGIEDVLVGRASSFSTEYELKTGSGHYWFAMQVDPMPQTFGGVVITNNDITSQKQAEEQLKQNEQWFRSLIEYSSEIITAVNYQGDVIYQSPSVSTLMGYSKEELARLNGGELVHPDDLAQLIADYKELLTKPGEVHTNEFRFLHKDGSWHYMEATAQNLMKEPGIEAIIVSAHDVTQRKEVELALRQSEERLNFALSAAGIGIWEYEVQTGQVRWSAQVAPMLGLQAADFAGTYEAVLAQAHPQEREKLSSAVQKALAQGSDYQIEYRVIRPDGKLQWIEGKGRAYLDRNGQPLRLSGSVEDITKRKETETALVESQARFSAFMEHSPAAAFIVDEAANIVYVNKAYKEIFEFQDELVGRNCSELFSAEVNANHRLHDRQVLQTQQVVLEAQSWQRHNGSTGYWLGYKFPINESDGRRLVGGVGIDVTSSKQAEEGLRLSEARLAGIINSATDAIITLDSQQRIVVFNTAAEKMFGYKAEEVKDGTLDKFTPSPYRHQHSKHITNFGQTGTTVRDMIGTLSAVRQNGEEFPIEATISQVEAAGQKLYTVIIRDITERKKAEEALAQSEAQLRQAQKMEAVGQLAGGVAHDFNNLLTAISGYSELILLSLDHNDPIYEDVTEIQRAVERASNLTRQLLAFSRQQVLQLVTLDLNEVVSEMYRMLGRLIGEDIQLVPRLAEGLAWIKADRGQLEQVLVNLAVNARDAMPNGGKLIFETSNVEFDKNYTMYHPQIKPGKYVRLAVSDSGCGMSEKVRSRIFEPFFTTKELGRGTGLGLSTVYGIIKQSGGYIEVYSEEGIGSSFKIYLPIVEEGDKTEPSQAGSGETLSTLRSSKQESVLVVEDEEEVRNLTERILEHYNYRVLLATSGIEALAVCRQYAGQIDLLLTDVVMPQLSGPALVKQLLELQPAMKVLYMSGYTDGLLNENKEILSEAELLQKPFTVETLIRKIREKLES